MKLKDELKDWEIARGVFGKNTQKECKIIKELRKAVESEEICEGWYELRTKQHLEKNEIGWFIPIEYLNF